MNAKEMKALCSEINKKDVMAAIDCIDPNDDTWGFFAPYVQNIDGASMWTDSELWAFAEDNIPIKLDAYIADAADYLQTEEEQIATDALNRFYDDRVFRQKLIRTLMARAKVFRRRFLKAQKARLVR